MAVSIRQLTSADAGLWLDLFKSILGDDYPDKQVYEPEWIATQLSPECGHETWGAEVGGKLQATVCLLAPTAQNINPIANLGRSLFRPESYQDGSAEALQRQVDTVTAQRGQMIVARVLASDAAQQTLLEQLGYVCAGFQPFKHMLRVREGTLFYVRYARPELVARLPLSESLAQVSELAIAVLGNLSFPTPTTVRDGATGYPLQTELQIHDATYDDFELWRLQAEAVNPFVEVSGGYNTGQGYLRVPGPGPTRALLGQRDSQVVAGLAYIFDEQDRCVRVLESFSTDDLSLGAMFHHIVKVAQEQLNAVYIEVDVLMTAPRLLKSVEQLGFVPVAYLPAFFAQKSNHADVAKLVKLNMVYSLEGSSFTTQAHSVVNIVDQNFQDQKVGVAIINLLRGLPVFVDLGDGELRKIARLFTQKLFRPGEKIFNRGDIGNEAYVIMRGQIDIVLEENATPIASMGNGQIFGELAFLDGAARVAMAVASQASILLVMQRSAFNNLVQREPHLGMVVMRNIAIELSNRLRRANAGRK